MNQFFFFCYMPGRRLYTRTLCSLELSHRLQVGKILNPPVGLDPRKISPARALLYQVLSCVQCFH